MTPTITVPQPPQPAPAESLLLEGPDALAFAQAQFAGNVLALTDAQWQFNAWLNAQGRVRALFQLARLDEHRLLLLLRGGEAQPLADALRPYVFRSRVSLTPAPWRTLATAAAMPLHSVQHDADHIALGCGTHSLRLTAHGTGDAAWRAQHVLLGWPHLPTPLLDTLLPASLALHHLQAVALDKGCYPGQEIVARMHWRGGNKRHLCRLRLDRVAAAGHALRRDGHELGVLLDVAAQGDDISALGVLHADIHTDDAWLSFDDGLTLCVLQQWES